MINALFTHIPQSKLLVHTYDRNQRFFIFYFLKKKMCERGCDAFY